ncbi:MAG TPA: prepilin-type N-terminal cleavage/methylation domain-containing protein [Burkholderiaceae bacterium]|nr:prepilin-type N-terminal cleavage/methylation domain-containing protein [Burkholderiaceae bacterium]
MDNRRIKRCNAHSASVAPPVRQSGLTLIELLVAISVLAFVAVLGWRGLDGIVRARIALTSDLEQTRGMQLAFAQLQNDCAHLASEANLPDRTPLVIDQNRLTLVRTVFGDNQPSQLQVITYRVNDGVLTRRESAATRDLKELDNLWQAAAAGTDAVQPVVLQSGVNALTMRLWSSNGWGAPNANAALPPAPAATTFRPALTGMEVALQLQGRESSMLKVFLLGAV